MHTLTIPEAAAAFKVSEQTIRRQLRAKKLAGIKIGAQWRVLPEALKQGTQETPLPAPEEIQKMSRAEAADACYGILADLGFFEDFLAEKQEDIERENQRDIL